MKIDCLGCAHGSYGQLKLEGGDLLIITGDLTKRDEPEEFANFVGWLQNQKYKKKIVIAGNHDNFIRDNPHWADLIDLGFKYLCDSGTEFEYEEEIQEDHKFKGSISYKVKKKLKIWGSPWSLTFPNINPHCAAFTGDEDNLKEQYAKIPGDIDILITHSPPWGILDQIDTFSEGERVDKHVGSISLRNMVLDRKRLPKLKHHFFSHIHEKGGNMLDTTLTKFYNCSIMNENYRPVNKPFNIEI